MRARRIRPCPHCNGIAFLVDDYSYRARAYYVYVKCEVCDAQGRQFRSTEDPRESEWNNEACDDAINAWNMRANEKD